MKKMLLMAALVGVAFTSCVKNEEAVSPKKQQQIVFEPATYKASSRATNGAFDGKSFGAFAYYSETADNAAAHTIFMENVEVTEQTINGKKQWAPAQVYYWPYGGHLDFVCYAPYFATGAEGAIIPTISDDAQTTLAYSDVTIDADHQTDLMYSDKAMNYSKNTVADDNSTDFGLPSYAYDGVPTLFHHALAKLNFKFQMTSAGDNSNTYQIKVTKLELLEINEQGGVSLSLTNDHTKTAHIAWTKPQNEVWTVTDDPTDGDVSKVWESELTLTSTEAKDFAKDYYVLPQELKEGQQAVRITYEFTTTNPDGQATSEQFTPTINLKTGNLPSWQMGKNITYTIAITPAGNMILFAPAVVDWEEVPGNLSVTVGQ